MKVRTIFRNNQWLAFIPIVGIILYTALFFIAKDRYAGGWEEYLSAQQVMCDLMQKVSYSGYENDGRILAIIGNTCLFIGMATFFYLIPLEFKNHSKKILIAQSLGVMSMLNFLFLFTDLHDVLVLTTGVMGTVVVSILIMEYWKRDNSQSSIYAIICLVCSILVFICYQFKIGMSFFPTFQKTVFLMDSIWVFSSCYRFLQYNKA